MRFIPSTARSRCTDTKVACGFDGIGKVERQSRFGQNLPQTGLSVFRPKTLPLPATRLKGIRQRKQATDGKSGCRQSVSGAVAVSQHPFYVGFTVEDFATQLDVGYPSLVAVVLKRPAAHLQSCRHLLVGEETLPVQCRAVVGGQMLYVVKQTVEAAHEVDYPLVFFVNQFIHITLDLVELLSLPYSVVRLSCL